MAWDEQALVCLSNREMVDASTGRTIHCEMARVNPSPPSTLAVEFCYSETRACSYRREGARSSDGSRGSGLEYRGVCKKINRSHTHTPTENNTLEGVRVVYKDQQATHTHTHTSTENNTPATDTLTQDKNNTSNPQTNTPGVCVAWDTGGVRVAWDTGGGAGRVTGREARA